MKKIFISITFTLFIIYGFGQVRSGNVSFSYTPQSEGFVVNGSFSYEYSRSGGEPYHKFNVKYNVDKSRIKVNGKWYGSSEIGSIINDVTFDNTCNILFDIYQNNNFVCTNTANYFLLNAGSASPSWSTVFNGIGEERAKELYKTGFVVRNARMTKVKFNGLYSVEKELERKEKEKENQKLFEQAQRKGDDYYYKGSYENAIEEYSNALKIKSNDERTQNRIKDCREKIKELERIAKEREEELRRKEQEEKEAEQAKSNQENQKLKENQAGKSTADKLKENQEKRNADNQEFREKLKNTSSEDKRKMLISRASEIAKENRFAEAISLLEQAKIIKPGYDIEYLIDFYKAQGEKIAAKRKQIMNDANRSNQELQKLNQGEFYTNSQTKSNTKSYEEVKRDLDRINESFEKDRQEIQRYSAYVESQITSIFNSYRAASRFEDNIRRVSSLSKDNTNPGSLVSEYKAKSRNLKDLYNSRSRESIKEFDDLIARENANSSNSDLDKAVITGMATAGKIIAVNQLAKEKAAALKKLENDLKEQMGDIKNKLIREINSNIRKNDELALNSFYRNYETYYLETSDYYNDWKNNIESKYNYKRSDWMEAPSSQPQKKNKEKINVPMYKYYLIRAKEKHKIKRDGFNEIALKFTTSSIALNNKYADSYAFLSELKEDILEKYYYILIASSLNSRDKEINKTRERLKSEFGDKLFNAIDNENTTFISNALDKKLHLGIIKENGIEILPYAIIYDKPKSFELILKNTKNNYYPVNNETHKLFLMALKHDAVKCVEVLHKNKVDISYANNIKEKISLYYTIVNGSDKSAQFILENVADVEKNLKHAKNLDDEKSIFKISKIATQYYIKANKPEEIRVIFNYYPELYYIAYSDNDRMVEYAVTKSRVLVLDLFIEKGLDINLINPKTNKSLMQYAADYNRTFMYDYLKNKGYNIHAQMGDNGNLVNYAVETDNNDFLNFLLENKVSISCKGADGSTPISKSINHFLISNFQTLLKYCNEEDMAYALNCAIVANNKFFVVRALQNGVDPYKIAKSPLSVEMIAPYQLAKQFRNKKIINILNSYSCYYKRLPKKFNEISDSFFDLKNETEKTKYLDQLIFESIKEYNKRKDFITRKDYLKTSLNNYRIYKKHGLNIKNIDYAERKIEKLKYKLGRKSLGIAMLNKESKSTDSTSTTFYGIAVPLISEWAQHDRMFGVNTTIWEFYYGNLSGLALNPIIGAYNNFNGIGGAAMFVADKVNGISFGLFGGGADKVNGVIVCGIAGLTSNCNGIIITGGASVSEYGGVLNGIQISGLGNFGEGNYINVNGIQVSTIANLADNVKGIQIGIYNEASNLAGVQFGLWNNNGNFSFPFINIGFGGNNNKSKKENYKTIPYEMYKTNSEYGKWQIAKQNKIVRSNVIETKNQNDKFSLNKVISNENISDISKLLPGYNINVAFEDREIFNKKWKSVSKFTIKQELYTEDSDKPKVTITDTTIVQYIEFESTKKGIIIKLSEANQDEYIYNGKTHYIHSKSTIGSDEFKTESNVSSSLSFFKNAEGQYACIQKVVSKAVNSYAKVTYTIECIATLE